MAIVKQYTRRVDDAGRLEALQELSATGTELTNYGVSIITSTSTGTWNLAAPVAGLRKTIVAVGSTDDITVDGNGATINGSTAVALDGTDSIDLIGTSTGAWRAITNSGALS